MSDKKPTVAEIFEDPGKLGGTTDPALIKNRANYDKRYEEYIKKYGAIPITVYIKERGLRIPELYYHAKVRSEGNEEIIYDVILYLYATDDMMEQEPTFKDYKIKIFSNSPAFTFKYAYVYHKLKLIPEELLYKYSKVTLDKEPTKTNPNEFIGFDSSTYFVLAYLVGHPELMYRKGIKSVTKQLNQFDLTTIMTPDEVNERRSPKETSTVKKLEKTLKNIINKPKHLIFGGSKSQKVTATGATKAVKAKHAVKASRPKKPR